MATWHMMAAQRFLRFDLWPKLVDLSLSLAFCYSCYIISCLWHF